MTTSNLHEEFAHLRAALEGPVGVDGWHEVKTYAKRIRDIDPEYFEHDCIDYIEACITARWSSLERTLWSDDVFWRYLEANPYSRVSRLFNRVKVKRGASRRRAVLRVLDGPILGRVEQVELEGCSGGVEILRGLLSSRHLGHLDTLRVVDSNLEGFQHIEAPRKAGINQLIFTRVVIDDDSEAELEKLVSSHQVDHFEIKRIGWLPLSEQEVRRLNSQNFVAAGLHHERSTPRRNHKSDDARFAESPPPEVMDRSNSRESFVTPKIVNTAPMEPVIEAHQDKTRRKPKVPRMLLVPAPVATNKTKPEVPATAPKSPPSSLPLLLYVATLFSMTALFLYRLFF